MRKLVLILIGFIAVITFIRAYDVSTTNYSSDINSPVNVVNIPVTEE